MFFKYSIFYDMLVLHVFCNAVFPCFVQWTIWPQRNKMIIDREIGRRKKPTYFVIDERLIMRVYLYLEKWDYIDEMQKNRMISSQTGIMLIGEKDGKTARYEQTRWKSRFLSLSNHARCRTTLLMLDTCTISIVFSQHLQYFS